ncbi:hypothetical protein BDW71DRAFT_217423 [Aspergillus fruticulosus]
MPGILFVAAGIAFGIVLISKCLKWRSNPLNQFPGPWSASFSNVLYSWHFMGGRQPFRQLELHEKYGSVVRVAPNELSFNTSRSWRDIYGVRKDVDPFIKSEFYSGGNFAAEALSIVSERDPESHAEMRKYLASAFSDRSLKSQEPLIVEAVDRLIEKLGQAGQCPEGTDLVMWYNLTTFDIIGSLAFGQDFGGVESGTQHFWVSIVTKSLRLGALADCLRRFPAAGAVFQWLFSGSINKLMEENRRHQTYTMDLVKRRLASNSQRRDFLTKIIEARKDADISDVQIAAHSSDFVIAGSETTATALACMTYYILRDPAIMDRLKTEIRSAFSRYEEITATSTNSLTYLRAVAQEAMRIFPPLPFALPRVVPAGGSTVDGHYLPPGTIVSTSPFAASMSSANFHNPCDFNPDRWLGENEKDDLEASQPFSLGTRSCMGRSLGWMELQTIMAKLIFSYDLELVNKDLDWLRDSRMHTLWEKPQLMVRISPRDS